jgi:hypothetical protein
MHVHATKTHWEWKIAVRILNLGTSWGEWLASRLGPLTSNTRSIDIRVGLNSLRERDLALTGNRTRFVGSAACSLGPEAAPASESG